MSMHPMFDGQKRQKAELLECVEHVNTNAERALRTVWEKKKIDESELAIVEANEDIVHAEAPRVAAYIILLGSLPFIYYIDLVLIGTTAEYSASKLFPHAPMMTLVARFLIPAAMLGVELYMSVERAEALALPKSLFERMNRKKARPWTIFGVLWAVVMLILVVATQSVVNGNAPTTAFRLLGGAMALLAFVLHLIVLFSGRLAFEAKGFFVMQWQLILLRRKKRYLNRQLQEYRDLVRVLFGAYSAELDSYNRKHPSDWLPAGPFTEDATTIVDEMFGEGSIAALTVAQAVPQ